MAESKSSFVEDKLGHGSKQSKRAASWSNMIIAEIESKEIELEDNGASKEDELKVANQEVIAIKAKYDRRKKIDLIKALPPNPNGAPHPPRDPSFAIDDATLGSADQLNRDWKDQEVVAEKRKKEKTKMYSAVASVVEIIMVTVDKKHRERVSSAMARPDLKGNKLKQLRAAIEVVTKNLDTDAYDVMQDFRSSVTDLKSVSPVDAQEVLDIIHKIESIKAEAEAYSLTFTVPDLLLSADIVSTIKGVVSHMSSSELGPGAEELIRKAKHDTDWTVLVQEVSRELNSKTALSNTLKRKVAAPLKGQEKEGDFKAFKAKTEKEMQKLRDQIDEHEVKARDYHTFQAAANQNGRPAGDGICYDWNSELGCKRGDFCRYKHPNGKSIRDRKQDSKDRSEKTKTTSSQSSRSTSPVSRVNTPRRGGDRDSSGRSSPTGSRSASPVKGRGV